MGGAATRCLLREGTSMLVVMRDVVVVFGLVALGWVCLALGVAG